MDPETIKSEIQRRFAEMNGWNTATVRGVRREFSRHLAEADARSVVKLAIRLIEESDLSIARRFFAYELVLYHRPALQSVRARDVEALGRGLDSWAAVDTFASYISGPAWREAQLADSLIHRWARSRDRWWRRAALVSTVPLNCKARGGRGDKARTLAVCDLLLEDRDDMVVKAMSWALRELAKRDPKAAKDYLSEHASDLAPRVLREVGNKLRSGLKNPRQA
jgi:3-methyladenine DNA glycosylase AlkD